MSWLRIWLSALLFDLRIEPCLAGSYPAALHVSPLHCANSLCQSVAQKSKVAINDGGCRTERSSACEKVCFQFSKFCVHPFAVLKPLMGTAQNCNDI